MEKKFTERKPNRLRNYDYSQNGCYFITLCTKDRCNFLSEIVGNDDLGVPKKIVLKPYGIIAEQYINSINTAYKTVFVENYIIMPNHVHLLILIDTYGLPRSSAPTISNIISAFKHLTNRKCGVNLWQRSFYDHIIRNEEDFQNTWNYIEYNALKEYVKNSKI